MLGSRQSGVSSAYEETGGTMLSCCLAHVTREDKKIMKSLLIRLWKEEEGQDLVEYALLLVLLALVASAAIKTVGTSVNTIFTNANTNLT